MAYQRVPFGSFAGGLNLRDAPGQIGPSEAIDLLNVTFTERGAVGQRAGYAQLTASELTNQPDAVFSFTTSGGTKRLLVGNGNRIDALDTAGASQANSTAPTANPHYFVRFGGPTAEAVYFGNGTDQIRKFVVDAFSSPAGLSGQTGRFVAVTPKSNRLVVARESGTTAGNNPSSVNFSDAGAPETFTATNFVDLDPGDGEAITGICTFGDLVFIFKESKFWVNWGESTDATGLPVFEVRKIDTGVGLVASRALAVGRDGVYFMGRDGVYRTTGGAPELLSSAIEPFFLGGTSSYFLSSGLNHGSITAAAATWHDHKLYLAVPTGSSTTNDKMLVHDPRFGWWTLYDIPAAALTRFRIGNQAELVFAGPTGSNYIYRHSSAYLKDAMSATGTAGSGITSRWRSGWNSLGNPDQKTIRELKLWGIGGCDVLLYVDRQGGATPTPMSFGGSGDLFESGSNSSDKFEAGANSADLFAGGSAAIPILMRASSRGTSFSLSFRNSTAGRAFLIDDATYHVRDHRVPSVTT